MTATEHRGAVRRPPARRVGGGAAAPAARRRAPRLPAEERRAQIVASAVRVLADRGLGAASQTDVAREAGVSVPAVFFYFRTREVLVEAVLDDVAQLYLGLADRFLRPDVDAPQALLDFARGFADSVDARPDHARVWLDWSTAIRGALWPRYREFQGRIEAAIAATLRRGQREGTVAADVATEDEARLFVGAAYVVTQMKFGGATPAEVERFLHTLVRSAVGRWLAHAGRSARPGRAPARARPGR